ncbi:Alpha subunit of chaperonin-containing T-complex [Phytophthora pseudosyringae]|uniref:Alpha subunit of chaperonin-containing T-complex n=1 Tax=Phytophthora pseudosyringae TaxID=221518 RepID=A0A8T1WGT9_9STRA|nr:Alpha subunit of chaperonin-containing T-complex [Phytophthora pseudosyringae]
MCLYTKRQSSYKYRENNGGGIPGGRRHANVEQGRREQIVTAAVAIANIVKNSLGPVGLDKNRLDDIGDVTINNNSATILKNLEVEQTAVKFC